MLLKTIIHPSTLFAFRRCNPFLYLIVSLFSLNTTSCKIYRFTDAAVDPNLKTFNITQTVNISTLQNPNAAPNFTEKLKDKFLSNTRLILTQTNGDLQFNATIVEYNIEPIAITNTETTTQNRLNISIKVECINTKDANKGFTQTFRDGENYDANVIFTSVENGLVNTVFDRLTQQIFNKTFGNWKLMNYQIQDILSNPILLKDVSDETIQSWIQQYPYVPLFHLFALKNKNSYSDNELHKTAFYFNNREKLYHLLNDKSSKKTNTYIGENENEIIDVENIIEAEETIATTEIISNENENTNTETINSIEQEKPLSIADKILLEIQQLKEERAKKALLSENENNVENKVEAEEINLVATSISTEGEDIKDKTKHEIIDNNCIDNNSQIEDTSITIQSIETADETTAIENFEIQNIEQKETIATEEPQIETSIEEKATTSTISIQDEIIARIQKIKEDREKQNTEAITENISPITSLNKSDETEEKTKTSLNVETAHQTIEDIKIISLHDDITARLEKIKEEEKSEEEKTTSDITVENEIKIIPLVNENEETISTEKTAQTAELNSELRESLKEAFIKNEFIDLHEEFEFPVPLLINIDKKTIGYTKELYKEVETKKEDISSNLEPEIIQATTESIDQKIEVSNEFKVENKIEAQFNNELKTEILSETVEIVNSDSNEATTKIEVEAIKEMHIEITTPLDEHTKEVPHTFIEWLKLLDGSLQIQTSEAKEPENWIEIPRYEVEQTIANKQAIQQEENKIFEPNFEEGEIDLFNEIDEAVTKVANESVSFKQDMMTETLAKIYLKQGKTDKALEIYNTLLMKFPEKSAYFTSQIEKLKNKI